MQAGRRFFKVASWNVNSIRARRSAVAQWLEKEAPDVLCLQETKAADDDFPERAFGEMDYICEFSGEKSYNGVAILSRFPVKGVKKGFEDGGDPARIITATINGIPVVNTYVPQGFHPMSEKFRYKLDWFERLYEYFDRNFNPAKPLLWVGDFNVAPEEKDVHDPKHLFGQVGFHPDELAALERFKDWGFIDVFRLHDTGGGKYTFWDYRARNAVKRGIGWRVDHIWATRPLVEKSKRAWIDIGPRLQEKPSDHAPVVAEFRI
ncbi:MAG: exodeoxyribonuclease III [Deltaproteobacteria bacterium]|nr:exodeoxyribonuclease III [Deltaproteobacteria bacterium]